MMSGEEESAKTASARRVRQRVDAGEPRNSYSTIPNFSSRPSGLFGAFFSQNQLQFAGIFAQGFGPKMLNELLGRQVKDAATPDTMMTVDSAGAEGAVNFDCLNASSVIRRGLDEDGSPPPAELAHHMLRDILQGRKKELLALEQELRVVNAMGGTEPPSPDNNNSINNNNNELKNGAVNNSDVSEDCAGGVNRMVNGVTESDSGDEEGPGQGEEVNEKQQQTDMGEDGQGGSDSEPASPSPSSSDNKDDNDDNSGNKDAPVKTEQIELKRARVENIVSSMRSSPSLPNASGCKKRKRYHPQQHDNSAAERYAALGINMNMSMLIDDDDDEEVEPSEIRQKKIEKDALKSQLRTMQEQLAEMQQKYVQLCTRMDQESESPDNDENSSDMEQDASNLTMPEKPATSTSAATPVKESTTNTPSTTPVSQPILSPAVAKMLPSKMHPGSHIPPQHLPLPPTFNGALSLLQQQVLQEQHGPHGPLPHPHLHPHPHSLPPHHALSNAAAMYLNLGVSHKLYMEQEARMAKEAAIAAEQQHHHQQQLNQQHHNHQQHMLNHHQQQQTQQSHQQQQQPPVQQQQQSSQTPHSQPSTPHPQTPTQSSTQTQASTPQQNHHQMNQSPPQQPPHPKNPTEFSDRLNMLRSQALAPPVSGSDLEGLADVLKTEITSSLSNLIDSIMSRFVQQRRFFGKQSEAAAVAAEQLNKDLLLASQLLDRKSPRNKVVDRGSQGPPERTPSANMNGSPHIPNGPPRLNGSAFPSMPLSHQHPNSSNNPSQNSNNSNPENNINTINLPHVRPSPTQAMFQPPKPPTSNINSVAAVALYNTMSGMSTPHNNPFCVTESRESDQEQKEALSLVVVPKKKRHKVTDTRITPRTVSRILAQDGIGASPQGTLDSPPKYNMMLSSSSNGGDSPPPRPYHPPPPPMLPVSLPTSVAIPNPSLHESQVFSPYSPFYSSHHQGPHIPSASPPGMNDLRESPPLHPPTLLHPALLAAAQHGSPDYGNMRTSSAGLAAANDSIDRSSDCNSADGPYDGITPTISFSNNHNYGSIKTV